MLVLLGSDRVAIVREVGGGHALRELTNREIGASCRAHCAGIVGILHQGMAPTTTGTTAVGGWGRILDADGSPEQIVARADDT